MKTLNLQEMEVILGGDYGVDTMKCFDDAYTNHGWASFALVAATALVPIGGMLLTTLACADKNNFK